VFVVLCVDRGLRLADQSFRGVLPAVCDLETSAMRRPRSELAVVLEETNLAINR
jgi:hypothetical protein